MSGYQTHLLPVMPVFICKSHPDSEICFTEINRKHNFLFIHIYLCHPASFNLAVFLFKIGLLAGCESEPHSLSNSECSEQRTTGL